MILSHEQLLIDAEMFRMNKQSHRGIKANESTWLDDVIQRVGPGGNFLGEKSTATSMRSGEWLMPSLGVHEPRKAWEASGKKDILEEAREKVDNLLATHEPLPLPPEVERELDQIEKRRKNPEHLRRNHVHKRQTHFWKIKAANPDHKPGYRRNT